jgi:hypothetical protein
MWASLAFAHTNHAWIRQFHSFPRLFMTSRALLKKFCNIMEVLLNRRKTMNVVMSKYVLATVASPEDSALIHVRQ